MYIYRDSSRHQHLLIIHSVTIHWLIMYSFVHSTIHSYNHLLIHSDIYKAQQSCSYILHMYIYTTYIYICIYINRSFWNKLGKHCYIYIVFAYLFVCCCVSCAAVCTIYISRSYIYDLYTKIMCIHIANFCL